MEEKKEKYYIVSRKYNDEKAFIKFSNGKLEHIAGEKDITRSMKPTRSGTITNRIFATSNYDIIEYNKESFELHKDQYRIK